MRIKFNLYLKCAHTTQKIALGRWRRKEKNKKIKRRKLCISDKPRKEKRSERHTKTEGMRKRERGGRGQRRGG